MRFARYRFEGRTGLAVRVGDTLRGLPDDAPDAPGRLDRLVGDPEALRAAAATLERRGSVLDEARIAYLAPVVAPGKVLCVGLNYADHTKESPYEQPGYPTMFTRFWSTFVGHRAPIVRPRVSEQLDYEGELALVIGRPGRAIPMSDALAHVAGYSVFNDVSVRDYQFKTPQWTVGKNFDGSGPFGPDFVSADELPPGCKGLRLQTRLNGRVVQSAPIDDMLFDVATLVTTLSEVMTLETGDVIVTGTPSGVGFARKPPLWMKDGDVCEVEIDGVGLLSNPVVDEEKLARTGATGALSTA